MPELLIRTAGEISVYIEAGGMPVTGREVNVTVFSPRNVTLISNERANELGEGWYVLPLSGSQLILSGYYRALWQSPGAPFIQIETFHQCGYVQPGAVTRGDLRLRVARECGLLLHRGSADASSTATVINDKGLVVGGDGEYAGAWYLQTSGTSAGYPRRITQSNKNAQTMTLAPALPARPSGGDRYVVLGYDPAGIDEIINDAITSVAEKVRIEMVDESLVTVAGQVEYDLPAPFLSVHRVDMDIEGVWEPLAASEWDVAPGHLLRLTNAPADSNIGIRVAGVIAPEPIYLDQQYCEVSGDYVVAYAMETLHAALGGGDTTDPDDHRRAQAFYAGRRELERKRAVRRIPTGSRRVR